MKTILLMRHSKSDWRGEKLSDFDRPLKVKGEKDSTNSGKFLRKISFLPDIIISSPALRASKTTENVSKELGYKGKILWKKEIYYGESFDVEKIIRGLSDDHQSLVLIGHNPLLEDFVSDLTGIPTKSIRLATSAMALMEANIDSWKELRKNCCTLRWLIIPKILTT